MKLLVALLLSMLCVCNLANVAYAIGMAKVKIIVVDEDQRPIESAQIEYCFRGGCTEKNIITGLTDKDGVLTVSGTSSDGSTGGVAKKKDYYYTTFHHDFITNTLGIWQPWNKEIKVVLRPKIKPVPMYVRDKWVTIPVVGKEVGFDLIKFDWVVPYGLGTVADFVFFLESRYTNFSDKDSSLKLKFTNKYDGIQTFELNMGGDFGVGSEFRTPRYAPETGYLDSLATRYDPKAVDFHAYKTKDTYRFFRIRSEIDENGKLKRAMYGKMKGDLRAVPTKDGRAEIELYYWLNPDYTSNMEFDTEANLFSPLPIGEIDRWDP